jgi:hypothetical protein
LHQLIEYLVAGALVALSVRVGHSQLLVAGGAAIGLLAMSARGPLGLVRICGTRLHAVADVGVGIALAVAPIWRTLRPGAVGLVAIELVAVAWLRVGTLTRYTDRPRAVAPDTPPAPSPVVAPEGGTTDTDTPVRPGLTAVRTLGRMTARARHHLPEAEATLHTGARRLGGHAGRLQRLWRRSLR